MLRRMATSLTILAAFAVAAPAAGTAIMPTSLCALVAGPEAFDGKLVRFRAGVLTDWHHGTLLVHSGCQGGVELTSTDQVPSGESEALDRAVGVPLDGGRDRTAMATFTGYFSIRPSKPLPASDIELKFSATRIECVVIYPKEQQR
jgi:hypothetical protein